MIRSLSRLRVLARCALLLLPTLLLGCHGTGTSLGLGSRDDALPRILASGALRVGISADQPPFNMPSRSGGVMGFDVDLADALGDAMGLEVRYEVMAFAELLPALEARRIDLIVSAMTITPVRNARVPFAGPYFVSGTAVLAKPEALDDVAHLQEMVDADLRVATVAGTTNEAFARALLSAEQLQSTPDFDAAVASADRRQGRRGAGRLPSVQVRRDEARRGRARDSDGTRSRSSRSAWRSVPTRRCS